MRIGQQDSANVDYVANVVAFPGGVDEERDSVSFGFVLGTSLANVGKRWYAGAELALPLGFGLSAGGVASIVPELEDPLLPGQPFNGERIPTDDDAKFSWYVGINLQAQLFKKVFGALFSTEPSGQTSQ